jgi:RNA polymerase sigma-70 factor, ECF subfamily
LPARHRSPPSPRIHPARRGASLSTSETAIRVRSVGARRGVLYCRRLKHPEVLEDYPFGVQADEEVLTGTGQHHSFEGFFQHEFPKLVRLLFAMTADLAEAEDLAQAAMGRTWERWGRVSQMDSPGGYAYRVALNLQRKRMQHLRVRARRLPLLRPPQPVQPHVSGEVVSALAMLPPDQRAALLLIEWIGMSAEEAASILGITAAGVRTRTHRARRTLARSLEDEDE